jgi:3-oxoacyl-[acyl-carrier-protein] synthase II
VTRATGSGWIGARGFGSGQRTDAVWEARERFEDHVSCPPAGKDWRHYGRFDLPTRLVCHAVHLALQDAGYGRDRACPDGSGLIGTGDVGTLAANLAYYRDYCAHGKVLGRSNLFLYTLPTSSLAEAAIHFRLRGPLFFLAAGPDGDLSAAFCAADDVLAAGAVPCMLVCDAAPTAAIVHVIEGGRGSVGEGQGAALAAADALRRIAAGQDGSRA